MKRYCGYFSVCSLALILLVVSGCGSGTPNTLRVSETNPRYFTDNSGKAIYLTGSHTWDNLVDINDPGVNDTFDFPAYLDFLKKYNHNFFRLWAWDLLILARNQGKFFVPTHYASIHPWQRSGEGTALDGKPKFDLTDFNQDYFDRLRARVEAAGKENIYVGVMLFEGWGTQFTPGAYPNHPFHPLNNVNAIELDTARDARFGIYSLGNDNITRLQEAYVEKVMETVGDLDNVLYEISNENHPESTDWQYHMIRFIKAREKENGTQHPVGMTFQYRGGKNEDLFNSPADWISPNKEGGYRDNPPANTGEKVILSDTDHLWGIGGNRQWVWKSFLRGLNPIFMDPYSNEIFIEEVSKDWEEIRVSMGHTRTFAEKMDLIRMVPVNALATSGYCLASKGKEYLVYIPEGNDVEIDLSSDEGTFSVAWFDTTSGETQEGTSVEGGTKQQLTSPFDAEGAVVHLKRR